MSEQPVGESLTPEVLATLIRLKEIDEKISARERDLTRQPSKLDKPKLDLAQSEADAKDAGEVLLAAQKRIDGKAVESDAIQAEITKLEGQLFSLKTTTEFDAMKLQIAAKRDVDDKLQTEALELMEGLDSLKEAKARELQALADAKSQYASVEKEIADETRAIEQELSELRKTREAEEASLPDAVRELHSSICARRGVGVAVILDEICKGCDTRITMNTLNSILGMKLVTCPHCDRILYVVR